MTLPAGISLATIRVGKAFDFFGAEAQITVKVTPILGGTAKRIVWEATGDLLANFAGTFTGTVGDEVEFDVPHVDQAGFVDGSGDEFTMWFYRAEISLLIGRQTVQYQQDFQVIVGQDDVDLDLVPDTSIGEPVTVTIPPVTSVAGFTGVVTLDDIVGGVEEEIETLVEDALEAHTPGTELGYAASTASFSTNDAATLTTRIPDLVVPILGNGRPVEIKFFAPNVYHDIIGAIVTFYFVVDDVALTNDGQIGSTFSPQNTIGPSATIERRLVIPEGVTKTFKVGMLVGAGGEGHVIANPSARMHLSAVSR